MHTFRCVSSQACVCRGHRNAGARNGTVAWRATVAGAGYGIHAPPLQPCHFRPAQAVADLVDGDRAEAYVLASLRTADSVLEAPRPSRCEMTTGKRMDIFEAMETCRAIRNLKADPVSDELLQQLVHYATRAPSAGNTQLWGFVVVTDADDRRWFGDMLRRSWADRLPPAPSETDTSPEARRARVFRRFVMEFDRIPAFIMTCIENGYPRREPNPLFMHSSIYLATQNLLLAARALGLGAAMTTFHTLDDPAVKAHFGIPESVGIGATIPIGWPAGRYGPLNRKPDADVTFWNRWQARR